MATKKFVTNKVSAIGICLQAVSTQIVKKNAPDASAAAATCIAQFRRLQDGRGLNKQLSDKLAQAITAKCLPSGNNTHTLADIIGSGADVPQPLDAENLNVWCTHFGGDGSIDSLQEWIDCITTAANCEVDATIASQYPRAIEWLNLVRPSMQALRPPDSDPTKITDALEGLDAVKADIDGPDNDNVVSIHCGGDVATGTAAAGDVLSGKTFSNDNASGLTGTMPNNGAVTLTPTTTDQPIAAGYHNGAGKCVGDPDLVSGSLRSGVNLFGVNGDPNVVNTSSGDAAAGDLLSGKIAWAGGAQLTGTMSNNGAANFTPGAAAVPVPAGYYSGGQVNTDPNLTSANIKSGVTIFGVVGNFASLCGNGFIDGTEQCDQGNLDNKTCVSQGFAGGTLRCGAGCVLDTSSCYPARFVDNADGTIADNQSGLQWEKKVKLDGTTDFTNLQDADNTYLWAGTCSITTTKYCQPTAAAATACASLDGASIGCAQCTGGDGTCSATATVWTWLAAVNAANFGAHNDWRLAKRSELESILDLTVSGAPDINVAFQGASCGSSCTDITSAACACTRSTTYWGATYNFDALYAWVVNFGGGNVTHPDKTSTSTAVRAVRGS